MHEINLHGPWQLSFDGELREPKRLKYPCHLGEGELDLPDQIWLHRKFHSPTGITESEKIQLCFSFFTIPIAAKLNDQMIAEILERKVQIDVTGKLLAFNQISFQLELPRELAEIFLEAKMVIGV